jgi:hypothetical protein
MFKKGLQNLIFKGKTYGVWYRGVEYFLKLLKLIFFRIIFIFDTNTSKSSKNTKKSSI